jgi:PAS domain S-box-containing protein
MRFSLIFINMVAGAATIHFGSFPDVSETAAFIGKTMSSTKSDLNLAQLRALLEHDEAEMSVVFSDPSLPDNPMIFVSDEFERQTGYAPEESLGKNCRFLQGPGTSPHAIEAIRHALRAQTRFTIDILNYRKDGSAFVNRLRIRPIYDPQGRLMFFAGAQNPV